MPIQRFYPLFLFCVTAVFFSSCIFFDFVNWDDPYYVLQNPLIQSFDSQTFYKIFYPKTFVMGNYHPITILSYSLDYRIYGLNPMGYHATNVIIHSINSLLCYFLLNHFFKNQIIILFLTLLFAIHPMQIESIAWISGRKDLLASFFGLSFLLSSFNLIQKQPFNNKLILLSSVFFILALISKATMVILPLILSIYLVLFDLKTNKKTKIQVWIVVLFILSGIIGFHALEAQQWELLNTTKKTSSVIEQLPYAGYALATYVSKFFIPIKLSNFYPYPNYSIGFYTTYVLCIVLIGFLLLKRKVNLLFAFLFFIVTILPVLQIKPIGNAIIANRYLYFPMIGILLFLGFILEKIHSNYLTYYFVFILFGYSIYSMQHLKTWKNSVSMWTNTIEQFPEATFAYINLGDAWESSDQKKAISQYSIAIALDHFPLAYVRKARLQNTQEALKTLHECIQYNPTYEVAYNNLGLTYKKTGDYSNALLYLKKATELSPNYADAYSNIGNIYTILNELNQARMYYQKALLLDPSNTIYLQNINKINNK